MKNEKFHPMVKPYNSKFHPMQKLTFNITDAPFKSGNPILGQVDIVNGVPCPAGLDENCAMAIFYYLDGLKYIWLPRNKTMPEFDDQNPEHIRAAMNGLDCEGYHAEEV